MQIPNRLCIVIAVTAAVFVLGPFQAADAEYGDVVMNEFSDDAGMRPVVFPHYGLRR